MTTATCCQNIDLTFEVFAGLYELEKPEEGLQTFGISSFQMHEDFDSDTLASNLCLLFLTRDIQFENEL